MKHSIHQLPPTDAVQKFLTEFDAAQDEIARLEALAAEKAKEEEQLVGNADLNDREAFRALSDCRMMRELIPTKISRLQALADDLAKRAEPAVFDLSAAISRVVGSVDRAFKEQLDLMLRPIFPTAGERERMVEIVWAQAELRIRLFAADTGATYSTVGADGGIVAGRRLLDVVRVFGCLLPEIQTALKACAPVDSKR